MSTYETILQRRSIRRFNDKEIGDAEIEMMLKAAMAAPSAQNKNPWMFYVVKNKEIQEELKKSSRYTDYDSSLMIVVCGDEKRSLAHRINDFWIQDCSAAIQNILLVATELNIGTCWCGLFPMATPQKHVRKVLGLSDNLIPIALIHLGYSDDMKESRTRFDKKRVVTIE